MDSLEPLLVLQEHDLALDRLRHRRATLPERAAVATGEAAVAALDARIAEIQAPLAEISRTQERLEDEAQTLADQAVAAERKLYSGEVSSPRELQALQADVDQLRRHQREVEERALEAMEEREPLDTSVADLAAQRAHQAATLAEGRAGLAAAEAEVDGEITAEQHERDARASGIDAPVIALYERCRSIAPSGIGVARLVGFSCQGCHLTIPATEVDRIRRAPAGSVAHCDNCGAILVPSAVERAVEPSER